MNDFEFKVMPWLRALRDKNAEEEKGLTTAERLEKHRREAEPLMREFLKHHPEARKHSDRAAMVAEENPEYGNRKK